MEDIRTHFERKNGWWMEPNSRVPCALPKDGLLAVFRLADVEKVLDEHYPHRTFKNGGGKVWYFNETRDREIAETDAEGRVCANPQVLWEHFMVTA